HHEHQSSGTSGNGHLLAVGEHLEESLAGWEQTARLRAGLQVDMSARGEFSAPGFRLPVFGLRDSALGAFGLRRAWVDGSGARLVTQLSPSAVSCPIRHGKTPCFEDSIRASAKLSFFLAAFGRFWSRFALSLGLRLGFFHRFLGFGGALGPGFGALFLLFV